MIDFVVALPNAQGIDVNLRTYAGVTPLMLACKRHNESAVATLCRLGANPLCVDMVGLTARNYLLGCPEDESFRESSISKIIINAEEIAKKSGKTNPEIVQ